MSMVSEKKAKTAKQALLMAAELLSKRKWTKGWFAKNAQGRHVDPSDVDAVCWCGVGAIQRVTGGAEPVCGEAWRLFDRYIAQQYGIALSYAWNDTQKSKRPVIAALRKAASL